MRKLITILVLMLPVVAAAQKDLFMKEFNAVNNWFFVQKNIVLVQKYTYFNDSSAVNPTDSSLCTIVKNNSAIHYKIAGSESFSDKGYMVKISHFSKYMTVSKTEKTDTAQLRTIFNEGFSGFNTFTKTFLARDISLWELGGGIAGVNSAKMVMDMKNHKIKSLEMFMSGNHPLISPFRKPGQETNPTVKIKVDYQYPTNIKKQDVESLSDFIVINDSSITPSPKYKDYRIKLLTENQ